MKVIIYPTQITSISRKEGTTVRRAWRWRVVAGNGRLVASSGDAFKRKESAYRITTKLFPHILNRVELPGKDRS